MPRWIRQSGKPPVASISRVQQQAYYPEPFFFSALITKMINPTKLPQTREHIIDIITIAEVVICYPSCQTVIG